DLPARRRRAGRGVHYRRRDRGAARPPAALHVGRPRRAPGGGRAAPRAGPGVGRGGRAGRPAGRGPPEGEGARIRGAHAGEVARFDVRTDRRAAPAEEGRCRMTIELIAVVLCSMVIHEWAHASAADLEGDPVPRDMGRLTLNPFAHLDPFGSLIVPVVTFAALGLALGWCRPIPLKPMPLYRPGAYA